MHPLTLTVLVTCAAAAVSTNIIRDSEQEEGSGDLLRSSIEGKILIFCFDCFLTI